MNFVKFLRTPFFPEHFRWLILIVNGYLRNFEKAVMFLKSTRIYFAFFSFNCIISYIKLHIFLIIAFGRNMWYIKAWRLFEIYELLLKLKSLDYYY